MLGSASSVNHALSRVYGQVKRLERGTPEDGETMAAVSRDQQEIWILLREMRAAMRADLGVSDGGGSVSA
ncbi:hypothetical protein ACR3S4_04720 [Streptomyces sp. CH8.1]|uniref:hypothetical protein n=1 Tax=Streptomyces sp. CH8.1 TaxID=3439546 RepID=UPI003D9FBBC4